MRSNLMTLAVAADWLGLTGANRVQRLRRVLLRVEDRTGKTILVRTGDGSKRQAYLVTKASLRAACPELIDRHEPILRGMRATSQTLRAEVAALRESIEDMRSDINAMREGQRSIGRNCRR